MANSQGNASYSKTRPRSMNNKSEVPNRLPQQRLSSGDHPAGSHEQSSSRAYNRRIDGYPRDYFTRTFLPSPLPSLRPIHPRPNTGRLMAVGRTSYLRQLADVSLRLLLDRFQLPPECIGLGWRPGSTRHNMGHRLKARRDLLFLLFLRPAAVVTVKN